MPRACSLLRATALAALALAAGFHGAHAQEGVRHVVDGSRSTPSVAVGEKGRVSITITPEADIQFFACTEKVCERQMERVAIRTEVK